MTHPEQQERRRMRGWRRRRGPSPWSGHDGQSGNGVRRVQRSARAPRERGGTTMIVAVLMPVVLLGMGAMVLDIGALAQERAVLRNGADAAALAVTNACLGSSGCGEYTDIAKAMANANADDGKSSVEEVCGKATGLAVCTSPPTLPTNTKGYVRVKLKTLDAKSNTDKISFSFGRALGLSGRTVHQQTTYAWGPPAGSSVVPIIFSKCEYLRAIASQPLQQGPPFSGTQQIVYFHGSAQAGSCNATPAGGDLPGGFGWLSNSGCTAALDVPNWIYDSTGNSVPGGCDPTTWQNKTMVIPLYDDVKGTGANGQYHAIGFSAIYITSYRFPSYAWPSGFQCPGQNGNTGVCIKGYFTKITQSNSNQFGSGDFGSYIVKAI